MKYRVYALYREGPETEKVTVVWDAERKSTVLDFGVLTTYSLDAAQIVRDLALEENSASGHVIEIRIEEAV